jgi:transcriptional regulator with XRE-family HTH domain
MQLSENLNELVPRKGGNASQFARETGINRTQFNRYLTGVSWPRPDVLERICQYTSTDARIMTEPLAKIEAIDQQVGSLAASLREIIEVDGEDMVALRRVKLSAEGLLSEVYGDDLEDQPPNPEAAS